MKCGPAHSPAARGPLMAAAIVFSALTGPQAVAQSFSIISTFGPVTGVSDDGRFASGYDASISYRWSADSGRQDFGLESGFGVSNFADGISGDGQVVAGSFRDGRTRSMYRWSGFGTRQALGNLASYDDLRVDDLSRDGSVIVGHSFRTPQHGGAGQAFVWTPSGGFRGLGYTRGVGSYSEATGVSSDGSTVCGYSTHAYDDAFIWTAATGFQILAQLPATGDGGSRAFGISSDGSIVVGSSGFAQTACVWRSGVIDALERPVGYDNISYASSVSDDGNVIVGYMEGAAGGAAFVWTPQDGIQTMRNYLARFGVIVSPDFYFGRNNGVSADGLTFFGDDGYIATIPSPPSALCIGLGALKHRRRRRTRRRPVAQASGLGAAGAFDSR